MVPGSVNARLQFRATVLFVPKLWPIHGPWPGSILFNTVYAVCTYLAYKGSISMLRLTDIWDDRRKRRQWLMWGGFILALLLTAILALIVIALFTGCSLQLSHESEAVCLCLCDIF